MLRRNALLALAAVLTATLVVGASVAAVGLAASDGVPASDVSATANDETRTVAVSGSAEIEAEPDRAVVHLSVESTADGAEAARAQVAENVSELRTALRDQGIASDRIRSTGFSIREDRPREREKTDAEPTYRAEHRIEVVLDDIDRVGTVIETVAKTGGARIHGVEYTLSDERRQELRQEALRKAMSNADLEAQTIAESAGLTLAGVHSVSTSDTRVHTAHREVAMASDASATDLDPGPVTVKATVNVEYNATG